MTLSSSNNIMRVVVVLMMIVTAALHAGLFYVENNDDSSSEEHNNNNNNNNNTTNRLFFIRGNNGGEEAANEDDRSISSSSSSSSRSLGSSSSSPSSCSGYFCDKYIDTMLVLMTHNSNAVIGETIAPNQNHPEPRQFRDGIRGFAMDLYENSDGGNLVLKHGRNDIYEVDYFQRVEEILAVMDEPEYRFEFLVVQFEDHLSTRGGVQRACEAWGDRLILSFDRFQPLSVYLSQGRRVLLTTNAVRSVNPSIGMHDANNLLVENNYAWHNALDSPDMTYRRGPTGNYGRHAKLMNYFCTTVGLGSPSSSSLVNTKYRMQYHAREFMAQSYAQSTVNIIMIDYYDMGEPFTALEAMRSGDYGLDGCWGDKTHCALGTTCFRCCNEAGSSNKIGFGVCGGGGGGVDKVKDLCLSAGRFCIPALTCQDCCQETTGFSNWRCK